MISRSIDIKAQTRFLAFRAVAGTVLLVVALALCTEFAFASPADETAQIANKLSTNWKCDSGDGSVNMQLSFSLTDAGDVYDVSLLRGLENPMAIRASIHALNFAMPFSVQSDKLKSKKFLCTITGDNQKPIIKVVQNEDAEPIQTSALPERPVDCNEFSAEQINCVRSLCALLTDHPESSEIKKKISSITSLSDLSSNSLSWCRIAKDYLRPIKIQRNPGQVTKESCRAVTGALFQAYVLSHDKISRYNLEDAWAQRIAVDILERSKAEPILLASASVLTYQLTSAKQQYEQAMEESVTNANALLSQLTNVGNSGESRLSDQHIVGPLTEWKTAITWLPADMETLVVQTKFDVIPNEKGSYFLGAKRTPDSDCWLKLSPNSVATNKLLADAKIAFALHAGRNFEYPEGYGVSPSDSVDVLAFENESKSVSQQVMKSIRADQFARLQVEGTEVLCFDTMPYSVGRFIAGQNSLGAQFVCSPVDGVLIAANKINCLREVIMKMQQTNAIAAFPADWQEWKLVDTKSRIWGFNRKKISRRVQGDAAQKRSRWVTDGSLGFGFSCEGEHIAMKTNCSDEGVIRAAELNAKNMLNPKSTDSNYVPPRAFKEGEATVEIKDGVLVIEGAIEDNPALMLHVISSLGFFISI